MRASRLAAVLMASALVLAPTACSSAKDGNTASGTGSGSSGGQIAAGSLTIENAWVKAAANGMTAAFGELVNTGDRDVTVRSATSSSSPVMELHETVRGADGQMVMREKDGGFVIPAHSTYSLQPGGNHLMLMDVVRPVVSGDEVTFSLVLDDGSDLTFSALVKDYAGANENYSK